MAAAITWGIKLATFTPSGGSLVTLNDVTEISFDDSIDLQQLLTDANININLVFGTGGKVEVSIKSTDTQLAWGSTIGTGIAGSLAVTYGKRAAGRGYVGAADKILTFPNAVIGKRSGAGSTSQAGNSDFSLTCFDTGAGLFTVA